MKYPPGWYPTQEWLEARDKNIREKRELLKLGTYAPETRKRLDALVIQVERYLKENDESIKEDLKKAFVNLKEILCVEIYQ